jgi:hypothetical protein
VANGQYDLYTQQPAASLSFVSTGIVTGADSEGTSLYIISAEAYRNGTIPTSGCGIYGSSR